MELKEAIVILETHNKWRRGEDTLMTNPTSLGEAIDLVLDNVVSKKEMYSNMQYYLEYCKSNAYITPEEWLAKYKHS